MISKFINPVKRLLFIGVKFAFIFGVILAAVFALLNWRALYLRFFWQPPNNQEIEKKINQAPFLKDKTVGGDNKSEDREKPKTSSVKEKEKEKEKENQNIQDICKDSCLVIPKIGVTSPIVFSKSRKEEDIQEDLKRGVVHYLGTSLPGETGNCFIVGHSSNYSWRGGDYNTVFVFLDKLKKGDEIFIYYNGEVYRYEVIESFLVNPEQVEVLEGGSEPILTLMTCWPIGTNLKRLIVRAKLK